MIRVNVSKPYVEIDGMPYTVAPQQAMLANALIKSTGPVSIDRLMAVIRSTRGTTYTCLSHLRSILANHDYLLVQSLNGYQIKRREPATDR